MAVRVSSTDILTTTVSSTAGIVDPVASGITGWSPGHSDTSGTILDCYYFTAGVCGHWEGKLLCYGNCYSQLAVLNAPNTDCFSNICGA